MKERGILFQGPMVRALLAGTKTQTRRAIKAPGPTGSGTFHIDTGFKGGHPVMVESSPVAAGREILWLRRCPYGQPGDRLWVRETWGVGTRPCPHEGWCDGIEYRADEVYLEDGEYLHLHRVKVPDDKDLDDYRGGWKPSIHMPRWASRILLEVTAVRVERLGQISEPDALAEGVSSVEEYRALWTSINKVWEPEKWVWVIQFRRA
jgi:hypothetical protein